MTTELRIAFRGLRRTPLTSLAVLVVVALGIGAATTVFALLDAALLRPLPYRDADRLVALFRVERAGSEPRNPAPPADFADWREAGAFESMVAAGIWTPTLTGAAEPARIHALRATPGLFELLGVPPLLGRLPDDDATGVVLGHGLWQRRFGADPAVVGREIALDGVSRTVLAVMPASFRFPPFWATGAELWAPLELTPDQAADRGASYLRVFARLREGVTVADAQAAMTALAERLERTWPATNEDVGIRVEPLHEPAVAGSRRMLLLIGAAVGLVLLITCANVASVLLARALGRRGDVAVRVALGAGRKELVRHGLAESLLLTAAGGVLGALLALWALRMLATFGPGGLTPAGAPTLDLRVAGFATLLSIVTGGVAGFLPTLRLGRTDPAEALRTRTDTRGDARLRDALVVAEVALAGVLVAVAMTMASALADLSGRDPGFDTDVVATVVGMPGPRYAGAEAQLRLLDDVRARLLRHPAVMAVGAVNHLPVAGDFWRSSFEADGGSPAGDAPVLTAAWRIVGGDYFGALGVPIVRGRAFGNVRPDTPPLAIVNEAFARRSFGDVDPVGRRIRFGSGADAGPWMEVVAVAADAAQTGVGTDVIPEVIIPYAQNSAPWFREFALVVRLDPRVPVNVASLVASVVHAADPQLPVEASRRMTEVLQGELSDRTFTTFVLAGFSAIALLLAAVGLYALLLQVVRRRTREIAVRLALGASRADIGTLVIGHGMRLVGLGVAIGIPIDAAAVTLALRFLPGNVHWPAALAAVLSSLLIAVAAAAAEPMRLATRTGPAEALRSG